MIDKTLSIIKFYIKEKESIYNVCKGIKETVESKFDGYWYCNAFYNSIGFHYVSYDPNYSIRMKFGKLSITVQKIYDCVSIQLTCGKINQQVKYFSLEKFNSQKLGDLLNSGSLKDLNVVKSEMPKTALETIKQITIDSFKSLSNISKVCSRIHTFVTEKFGGTWQCFAYKKNSGSYSLRNIEGKFIHFSISDSNLVIFQTRE
jgi:hypothetical protein